MKSVIVAALLTGGLVFFSAFQKPKFDLKASVASGKEVYSTYCLSCHMEQGEGMEGIYPPLAKSDYLMADKKRSIQQVLYGVSGEMKVNGKIYAMDMAGFDMTDKEVSDVLNYVRNSFGNKGDAVTPEQVKATRNK
ncbi:MAG TPA: cytochrome c [Cyclobacteriaceae bacterium]|nr:cytochrome c [Cyclobacteriaceae bacterium]